MNHIIFQAVKEGASDIHIEPFEKDLKKVIATRHKLFAKHYI